MLDHRIERDRHRIDYTCENNRFVTDDAQGNPHGKHSPTLGSVFNEPLIEAEGYSLWLEHIRDKRTRQPCYWLMWYDDATRRPTVPMSSKLDRNDIANMARLLASFIP